MTKVLMIAKAMEKTGVTSVMLSYLDNIDKSRFQVDFATGINYEEGYKKHIQESGSHFHIIPNRDKNLLQYVRILTKLIKNEEYEIVHIHGNSAMIFPELVAAKLGGAKVRIAHSHNTMCNHPQLEVIARPIFNKFYTHALACSKEAGEWMFKNRPFKVINNGIDSSQFVFSESDRLSARFELGLKDELLVGHVGYFNYQKNHERLVLIFKEIKKQKPHARLLLIGEGIEKERIKMFVEANHLSKDVIFYGISDNIPRLMSAMDVFVLPSHFEGMPVVLLEAQASGLHCVISDSVSHEANVTEAVEYVALEISNEQWAKKIISAAEVSMTLETRILDSRKQSELIYKKKYDSKRIVEGLQKFYDCAQKESGDMSISKWKKI